MSDTSRVAVYIDFDNVVISRYDNVHGDGSWRQDNARRHGRAPESTDPVDLQAGRGRGRHRRDHRLRLLLRHGRRHPGVRRLVGARQRGVQARSSSTAPSTWCSSSPSAGLKNGADIRLSVDAVDDLFQHGDITHVVIVAGDSDYVPLAQRCKRMGRYVVGIGVAGSTSSALVAACDEFSDYGALPSVTPPSRRRRRRRRRRRQEGDDQEGGDEEGGGKGGRAGAEPSEPSEQAEATSLLERAMRVGLEKSDDGWMHSSSVKSQMQRMNPKFKEKALGFSSFRAFVESRDDLLDTQVRDNGQLLVRMR